MELVFVNLSADEACFRVFASLLVSLKVLG